jgi:hypothetical protein
MQIAANKAERKFLQYMKTMLRPSMAASNGGSNFEEAAAAAAATAAAAKASAGDMAGESFTADDILEHSTFCARAVAIAMPAEHPGGQQPAEDWGNIMAARLVVHAAAFARKYLPEEAGLSESLDGMEKYVEEDLVAFFADMAGFSRANSAAQALRNSLGPQQGLGLGVVECLATMLAVGEGCIQPYGIDKRLPCRDKPLASSKCEMHIRTTLALQPVLQCLHAAAGRIEDADHRATIVEFSQVSRPVC